MRALVTGAAGFIGSALAGELALNGFEVLATDSFSDYYSIDLKRSRALRLATETGISVLEGNLSDPIFCQSLFQKTPDVVFHLAGQAGIRLPAEKNYRYIEDNVVAFTNILGSSIKAGVPRFFYASSSSVYGNSDSEIQRETDLDLKPISLYGATKLANEKMAYAMSRNTQTSTLGLRFFSVYGPWGRPDMAYFKLIGSLVAGYEFQLLGSGKKSRDFTYIQDVISAMLLLETSFNKQGSSQVSDVVNVGGGNPHSIVEMIEILNSFTPKLVQIKAGQDDFKDVNRTFASIDKLKEMTGFVPSISLSKGLELTLNWAYSPDVVDRIPDWLF